MHFYRIKIGLLGAHGGGTKPFDHLRNIGLVHHAVAVRVWADADEG